MKKFNLHAFSDEAGQDLDEQIKALSENGYEGMEIRGVGGENVSKLTIAQAKEIKKRVEDAGLCVWSIGSPIGKIRLDEDFEAHMDLYKHTLELSAVFGAKAFRLFSFHMPDEDDPSKYENEVIERMGRILDTARGYDVKICHENEKNIFGDIACRCLSLYKALPELGGIFDPANFVQCGQDTKEAWEMLSRYITYVHVKDADKGGHVVPAGSGDGNISFILGKFYEKGGRDLTLEPHLKIFDGMKDLEKDFDAGKIGQRQAYSTAREAFDAAAEALRVIISGM